jgi:hypothetical protein
MKPLGEELSGLGEIAADSRLSTHRARLIAAVPGSCTRVRSLREHRQPIVLPFTTSALAHPSDSLPAGNTVNPPA